MLVKDFIELLQELDQEAHIFAPFTLDEDQNELSDPEVLPSDEEDDGTTIYIIFPSED